MVCTQEKNSIPRYQTKHGQLCSRVWIWAGVHVMRYETQMLERSQPPSVTLKDAWELLQHRGKIVRPMHLHIKTGPTLGQHRAAACPELGIEGGCHAQCVAHAMPVRH